MWLFLSFAMWVCPVHLDSNTKCTENEICLNIFVVMISRSDQWCLCGERYSEEIRNSAMFLLSESTSVVSFESL